MANKPLSAEDIAALTKPKSQQKPAQTKRPSEFQPPPQVGPMILVDDSTLCIVSGYYVYTDPFDYSSKTWLKTGRKCGTPTFIRVMGAPTCHIHAIRKLNEIIIELTDGDPSKMELYSKMIECPVCDLGCGKTYNHNPLAPNCIEHDSN